MNIQNKRRSWWAGILALAILVGLVMDFTAELKRPASQTIELAHFKGRILQVQEIKPPTVVTVEAPMTEAVRWGEDAILRYSNEEIMVYRPDPKTAGAYQVANLRSERAMFSLITQLSGQQLMVSYWISMTFQFISIALSFVVFLLLSILAVPEFRRRYGESLNLW